SNKFTDFAVTTTDKQVKHLSDYVQPGKYTFIDFWASWCGPCRAAIPHVRELYNRYKGKLNVLSISLDEKEPAWRKAMEQEKMEWTQLWLAKDQMEPAARAYYITSIPRLILLNADGEIVVSTHKPDAMSDYLEKAIK
ncbi:MAG: TlpA family protein disulfide reductase, partial [Prevotella sp.]|nr:TlpA family protein disulfide reductase [Prevotella sp.]